VGTLSLRIPNSLHEQIRQLAKREGISINQFVASAAAEKMSALLTEEYIQPRAKRASLKKFQKVLKRSQTQNRKNMIGCDTPPKLKTG
jgi:uncharacterized protein (DUF1778 family)